MVDSSVRFGITAVRLLAFIAAFLTLGDGAKGDEKPDVSIVSAGAPGNVFGDAVSAFPLRVEALNGIKGRLTWRLAAGTATIKAGEAAIEAGPNAPGEITIKIAVPPVKDGVVLAAKLSISVFEAGKAKPTATHERDIWIFPQSPFADRTEWLKKLKITLYDPKGPTAKLFAAEKIPFEEARDADAVEALKEGVLIVGEGLALDDEKGLVAAMKKAAAAGATVLCLAPLSGEIAIPGVGPADGLEELTFRKGIVRKLDKRLDADGWLPDGKAIASTLTLKKGDDSAVGEIKLGSGGWPWAETQSVSGKGRWAFCGLAIVAKWEAGPTPRFLFARMLEHLTESKIEPQKETDR